MLGYRESWVKVHLENLLLTKINFFILFIGGLIVKIDFKKKGVQS